MPRLFDFTVVLEPQPEGGFSARVPALPEVVTEGETDEESLAMAEDAIRLALAYRIEQGIEITADATRINSRRVISGLPAAVIRKAGLTIDEFRALL